MLRRCVPAVRMMPSLLRPVRSATAPAALALALGLSLTLSAGGPVAAQPGPGLSGPLTDPAVLTKGAGDLRLFVQSGSGGQSRVVLKHTFNSQTGVPAAPWQVSQGRMAVDGMRGLRSQVGGAAATRQQPASPGTAGEAVGALVGDLLNQALGTGQKAQQEQQGQQGQAAGSAGSSGPAVAFAQVSVPSAFRMEAVVNGRPHAGADGGGLELGLYQPGNAGYRLVMAPQAGGQGGVFELITVSPGGTVKVIGRRAVTDWILSDQDMRLVWERDPNGNMVVTLNGSPLGKVRDRSFQDAFSGVMIANTGGDWGVRQMTITAR